MKNLRSMPRLFCVCTALAQIGCGGAQKNSEPAEMPEAAPESPSAEPSEGLTEAAPAASEDAGKTVQATFEAKSGSKLSGTAKLTETPEGVKVMVSLENVPPGEHGAHVHEKGDCSAADGTSAGGHFNPASHPHALPEASPRHLGDLGNITIGADGTGTIDVVAPGANLKAGDMSSFLGKAIIVHEKKDDGGQPNGNAGGRIGCAVIP